MPAKSSVCFPRRTGMDATVINGANLFWPYQFGIGEDAILQGLVNSVPSIASFSVGCWLSEPLCVSALAFNISPRDS